MKRLIAERNDNVIDKNIPLEDKLKQLDDIGTHKQFVIEVSCQLSKYLMGENREEESLELMKRAFLHDISKLNDDEFYGMAKFADDTKALKDPKATISDEKQDVINLHWKRNEHHPEFWDDINKIDKISIMELACDWQARSKQFGTNSLEFLKERQDTRFHFPDEIYNDIENYLTVLNK